MRGDKEEEEKDEGRRKGGKENGIGERGDKKEEKGKGVG